MHPAARPDPRFTVDDILLFPDDGHRHEIIEGVHYVTPSPATRHQRLVQRLSLALGQHLQQHPEQGEVFLAPFDVVLSQHDVVEPDVLVIAGDQVEILTEQRVVGAPALVIEVLSPGTRQRDEQIKRRLYERAGVREYWLVDPELDLVKVFRQNQAGHLVRLAELTSEANERLGTPVLPGFDLPLVPFFA